MPSEEVYSVISNPQPPKPRITRRKSVSVTPAMGARILAGWITRSRILNDTGSTKLLTFFRNIGILLQEFFQPQKFAAQRRAVRRPLVVARAAAERCAYRRHFRIQIVHVVKNHGFANHGQFRRP